MQTKIVNLRNKKEYKNMTIYSATAYAEGFLEGKGVTKVRKLIAWQWLHDTGNAYSLQGWYGRTAQALINEGLIEE